MLTEKMVQIAIINIKCMRYLTMETRKHVSLDNQDPTSICLISLFNIAENTINVVPFSCLYRKFERP